MVNQQLRSQAIHVLEQIFKLNYEPTGQEYGTHAQASVDGALARVPEIKSEGFDPTTFIRALDLIGGDWESGNILGQLMLEMRSLLGYLVRDISGTDELVSDDIDKLNEVLTRHGLEQGFTEPLPPGELGFVALVHNLYKWLTAEANRTTKITTYNPLGEGQYEEVQYPGFVMARGGFKVYQAKFGGQYHELVQLLTEPDFAGEEHGRKSVWLLITPPHHELLPHQTMAVAIGAMLSDKQDITHEFSTAVIPMVDLYMRKTLPWMTGMQSSHGERITWACQDILFRMNEKAAEIIAATFGGFERAMSGPRQLIINEVFVAWGTELVPSGPNGELVESLCLAPMLVQKDQWKEPESIGEHYQG